MKLHDIETQLKNHINDKEKLPNIRSQQAKDRIWKQIEVKSKHPKLIVKYWQVAAAVIILLLVNSYFIFSFKNDFNLEVTTLKNKIDTLQTENNLLNQNVKEKNIIAQTDNYHIIDKDTIIETKIIYKTIVKYQPVEKIVEKVRIDTIHILTEDIASQEINITLAPDKAIIAKNIPKDEALLSSLDCSIVPQIFNTNNKKTRRRRININLSKFNGASLSDANSQRLFSYSIK